jgi:hypothetical protein
MASFVEADAKVKHVHGNHGHPVPGCKCKVLGGLEDVGS